MLVLYTYHTSGRPWGDSIIRILRVWEALGSFIIHILRAGRPWEGQFYVFYVFGVGSSIICVLRVWEAVGWVWEAKIPRALKRRVDPLKKDLTRDMGADLS